MKNLENNILTNQRGNSLLFLLVCLPIALTLVVLVVDVSRYQSVREKAQEFVDRLTLQGAKYLPNKKEVEKYVLTKLSEQNLYKITNIEITGNGIKLEVSANVDAVFDVLLSRILGKEHQLTVRESATATIAPLDLVIIMPDGLSMRPPIKAKWGSVSEWPESKYFNFVSLPKNVDQTQIDENVWQNWWLDADDYKIWATQSCYNPIYSAVKLFVLSLVNSYSRFDNSRFAVISTPGSDPLLKYSLLAGINKEVVFDSKMTYWDQENYLSDELCLLIASNDSRYQINVDTRCPELINQQNDLYYPQGQQSDCVRDGKLYSQEVIYYHASRRAKSSQESVFSALTAAIEQIASQANTQTLAARANLLSQAKKEVLLLINEANFDPSALNSVFKTGRQLDVRLVVVPFYSSDDVEKKQELDNLIEEIRAQHSKWIEVYDPSSINDLIDKILPEIQQRNKQVLLQQ